MARTALFGPPSNFAAIAPNDGIDLPSGVTRGIYVGVAGNIKITGSDDTDANAVIVPVPVGFSPISVKKVWLTGTTATGLIAAW